MKKNLTLLDYELLHRRRFLRIGRWTVLVGSVFIIILLFLGKEITYEKSCKQRFLALSSNLLSYIDDPFFPKLTGKEKLVIEGEVYHYQIEKYKTPLLQETNQYLQEVQIQLEKNAFKENQWVEGKIVLERIPLFEYLWMLLKGGESAGTC